MNILFCSPCTVDRKLGAASTLLSLADELTRLGCTCRVIGPEELHVDRTGYPEALAAFLEAEAANFDVIDCDYKLLDAARMTLTPSTLLVARAQLLRHDHLLSPLPPIRSVSTALRLLRYERFRWSQRAVLKRDDAVFLRADLVVLNNAHAHQHLIRRGIAADKILIHPNGLHQQQRDRYAVFPLEPPQQPVIGFVGTFEYRKGSVDLPLFFGNVHRRMPEVRLKLMGTRGRLPDGEAVRKAFPRRLHPLIEVVHEYAPDTLPDHLSDCSVGVFPSYAEGFPLGVLEMLAAAMPVVAYDTPGAPEMLPERFLVAPRDPGGLADKVVSLLQDRTQLTAARRWARERAFSFQWTTIASHLLQELNYALQCKRDGVPAAWKSVSITPRFERAPSPDSQPPHA